MPPNNPPPLRIITPTSTSTSTSISNSATTNSKLKPTLHLLPTQLSQAREANTCEYFKPRTKLDTSTAPLSIERDEQFQDQKEGKEKEQREQEKYQTLNFRGRSLKTWSSPVRVPEGFIGAVVAKDGGAHQKNRTGWEGDGDEHWEKEKEKGREKGCMLKLTEFEEVFVWGHEVFPGLGLGGAKERKEGGEQDVVVRGVMEWLGWAGKIHDFENEDEEEDEDMELDKDKGADEDGDVDMDIDTPTTPAVDSNITTTTTKRITTKSTTITTTSTTLIAETEREKEGGTEEGKGREEEGK